MTQIDKLLHEIGILHIDLECILGDAGLGPFGRRADVDDDHVAGLLAGEGIGIGDVGRSSAANAVPETSVARPRPAMQASATRRVIERGRAVMIFHSLQAGPAPKTQRHRLIAVQSR